MAVGLQLTARKTGIECGLQSSSENVISCVAVETPQYLIASFAIQCLQQAVFNVVLDIEGSLLRLRLLVVRQLLVTIRGPT